MVDNYLTDYFQACAAEENTLFQVEMDVTTKCNADCPFCFQGAHCNIKHNDMTLEEYDRLFFDLRNMGTQFIGFSGGEPFARKDFIDILELARKYAFRVTFITNAMLMSDDDIDRLADMSVSHVTVSFHSIDIDAYKKCFGIESDQLYYRALDNIKKMVSKGIHLGIAITLTNMNVSSIEKTADYFIALGIKPEEINYNSLLSGARDIEKYRPDNADIAKREVLINNQEDIESGLLCIAGVTSCSISPDGNVYPCTFFNSPAGNIKKNSIEEIWNESFLFKIIRSFNEKMFTKCQGCSANGRCQYCMASALRDTGNPFIPSDSFCNAKKSRMGLC